MDLIDKLRQHRDLGELSSTGNFVKFRVHNLAVFKFPGDENMGHLTINEVIK